MNVKKILLEERNKRMRPGLDDKILTSWNALMINGYVDAYNAFGEKKFIDTAIRHAEFILEKLGKEDGSLYRNYKSGKATINGFLEDYSFIIEALIALYQSTFDERWLMKADQLMKYVIKHFQNESSGMFYFTSDTDSSLITRKTETEDNVIPSSNSSIAKSLFMLSQYFENDAYYQQSKKMAVTVKDFFLKYPSAFSNWGLLVTDQLYPFHEIVISGKDADKKRMEFNMHFVPNKLMAGSTSQNEMSLLKNRPPQEDKTLIYVCVEKHCLLPVGKVEDAVKQIKK